MSDPYEGWAIVEMMGHRRLSGYVTEAAQYGVAMLRIDVPGADGEPAATQFYGGASIYALTPTTEAIARGLAERERPRPVQRWELPAPRERGGEVAEFRHPMEEDDPFAGDDDPWEEKGGVPDDRACRRCGCTQNNACVDATGLACSWASADLCTACVGKEG